jgi:transcriptional regulator with XRE-family HTH domain
MKPKSWRKAKKLTLSALSKKMGGIATGYLSEIENGKKDASGRVIKLYHKLSKGVVSPADF